MLENYNGLDMLDSFQTTVVEDRALLEGASTATIREHFQTGRRLLFSKSRALARLI
jgi:hypothetical protein